MKATGFNGKYCFDSPKAFKCQSENLPSPFDITDRLCVRVIEALASKAQARG